MTMGLSASDLEGMRRTAEGLMPDTCTIQRLTDTADAYGGVTRSWATTYTLVPCRLDRLDKGPIASANWMMTMPWDQAFTLNDRILFTGPDGTALTLEPVQLNSGRSWETATRVYCREV